MDDNTAHSYYYNLENRVQVFETSGEYVAHLEQKNGFKL